jgi:hypothetical protein
MTHASPSPSILRRAALALKEGEAADHDPADLLWEAANALERAARPASLAPDAEAARRRADRLSQALAGVLPLARAHVEATPDLPGVLEEPDGRLTTAEIALAEDALAASPFSAPLQAEPSGLADLPDDVFLDSEADAEEPYAPDTLDGAVLAAARAIRAQNARRIAGLDPDPQHAIARAEALARLRTHLARLDDDVPTGA